MKLPFLFNPGSGVAQKNPERLLARLPRSFWNRFDPVAFGPPWDFGPFIDQAASANGPLMVWGGDGTIHHAGRALVEAGCPVALAAVPGGSGNGLVRGLRTPLDPAGALLRLIEGCEIRMDLPRLDGIPFLNLCGTGFEATVAHAFDAERGRGFLTYAKLCTRLWRQQRDLELEWDAQEAIQCPPRSRTEKLRIAWQGKPSGLPARAWSLCFANLPQYGSGLWIAPNADPTDGCLQWATLERPTLLDFPMSVLPLFREGGRTHLRQEGRILRAEVRLSEVAPWHLDGEPAPARDQALLTVEKGAFRMQVTESFPWFEA